ncbi:MAG: hypothetical protein OXE96_04205 [Gemmatimonadetes bacterium]|nr:hypothetical protein [Gemmatimonadota bacterium]
MVARCDLFLGDSRVMDCQVRLPDTIVVANLHRSTRGGSGLWECS